MCPPQAATAPFPPHDTSGLPACASPSCHQLPAASCSIKKAETMVLWLLCSELAPTRGAGSLAGARRVPSAPLLVTAPLKVPKSAVPEPCQSRASRSGGCGVPRSWWRGWQGH